MKRMLEKTDMGELETILAYDGLKTLELVNEYFLQRAIELCPEGRILDVGCGTGKMLRQIKGDYELHGIDIDKRMINYARQQHGNASYLTADSNKLPFDSGYFDLVMCHSLLHHLEDPETTIQEIQRVVKQTGAVFVRDLSRPDSETDLKTIISDFASHYDEINKKLFENSLRASFTFEEWNLFFPVHETSNILFYNIAEKPAQGVKLDYEKRNLAKREFIQRRINEK